MSYADVNGLSLYYEEHGPDSPADALVLMHGGFGATEMMSALVPELARRRRVIAIDLQAHGRTADTDRPLRWDDLADDVAALLDERGLARADLMGYSLGGNTALRAALRHPDRVRRLVVVSCPCRRTGWYPEVLAGMAQVNAQAAEGMKQSPMYELYARIAPRVQDWPILCDKIGDLLRQDYDWTAEVSAMRIPTLLVYGDADSIPPSHIAEFYALLGGGLRDAGWDGSGRSTAQLAVVPGATHYDVFGRPEVAAAATAFLDLRGQE